MNNAELAEIRALLQASAAPERRSGRPLLGALRSWLPVPAAEPRAAWPTPRRVGLRPADAADVAAVEELLLSEPVPDDAAAGSNAVPDARRRAFGQRLEADFEPAPVLLLAAPQVPPSVDDADVGDILRRRALRLAPSAPAPEETPYHPEDLLDVHEIHTDRLYADAGIFEPAPQPGPDHREDDPERALLRHLERTFLAELAGLGGLSGPARP